MLCQVRRKVSEDDQTKDQDGRRERTGACHGRERRQLVMEDLASVPWSRSLKALCVTNRPVRDLWAAPPLPASPGRQCGHHTGRATAWRV